MFSAVRTARAFAPSPTLARIDPRAWRAVAPGDRVVVQEPDRRQYLATVTSTGGTLAAPVVRVENAATLERRNVSERAILAVLDQEGRA